MKKITLVLAGMLFLALFATKVSARKLDKTEIFVIGRHQVSVSWGLEPTGPSNYGFGAFTGSVGDKVRDETYNSGAIAAGYSYRISKFVEVGMAYSFTTTKGYSNAYIAGVDYDYRTQSHAILPIATFHWLNRSWGGLYSRIGLGVRFESEKITENGISQTWNHTYATLQISAVGVEVGRKFAGFAELGVGVLGVVRAGARYRF